MDQIWNKDTRRKIFALCGSEIPQYRSTWVSRRGGNPAEAAENCDTFTWQLSDAHMAAIDKAIAEYLDFDGSAPVK